MNKFAVVIPYFGKLKPSFALWYESARRNPDVDFFIFSDDCEPENPASNIKWTPFTLQKFNELAVKKLKVDFKITRPYKLCDFKPMHGVIFEDYLKGYEYWAYGDVDVLYGKISEFLEKIDYKKYCKINYAGHLCFMKNTPEINNLFKAKVDGTKYFEDVLECSPCAFDEKDMNVKARTLNIPFYEGRLSADMLHEKGMQLVDAKFSRNNFKIQNKTDLPNNYHYQLFLVENGRIVRYYRRFFKVHTDEFCYMHYRLELPISLKDVTKDTFLVAFTPKGFYDIDTSKLKNLKCFIKVVKQFNNRYPLLIEKFSGLINRIKKLFKK